VQWTVGILRHFRAFSTPEQNLGLGVLSTPAPPPLTQAVGQFLAKQSMKFTNKGFMTHEDLLLENSKSSSGNFSEDYLSPFLKIFASLVVAFASSSFIGILLCFILFFGFFAIVSITALLLGYGNLYKSTFESIIMLPIGAGFFTLMFGVLIPFVSAFQVIIFGLPAALLGWKFNYINRASCLITGFVLASFPWAELSILVPPAALVEFVIMGICGAVGGFCFWLTLRSLKFPKVS
jgi:hypothetical protein